MSSAPIEFHYEKGVAPMMWVFFALSLIELVVVHLFVALKWPLIGWTLTTLSAIGAIWILVWIRSFRKRPHRLVGDDLSLSFGSLKNVEVKLPNIARVLRGWEQGALQKKNVINLAGIAYPNRCIELVESFGKNKSRVFIRLDAPDEFDEALGQAGIAFGSTG